MTAVLDTPRTSKINLLKEEIKQLEASKLGIFEEIKKGNLENVKKIVNSIKDFDINVKDKDGDTILIFSSKCGKTDIVKFLVKEGNAKVDLQNRFGDTALKICASINGEIDILKFLVKEGNAKVDLQNNDGNTALISASINGEIDIVKFLVKEGNAKVDLQNNYGNTALKYASIYGKTDIVKFLVKEGNAKVDLQNNDGNTALKYASIYGKTDIVKFLENYKDETSPFLKETLQLLVKHYSKESIKTILEELN